MIQYKKSIKKYEDTFGDKCISSQKKLSYDGLTYIRRYMEGQQLPFVTGGYLLLTFI